MRKRTHGREVALQYLYLVEILGKDGVLSASAFLEQFGDFSFSEEGWLEFPHNEGVLDKEVRQFALAIISGCLENWEEFSTKMKSVVENFRFERVFPIDRAILRVALFEITEVQEIPLKVSMNEAIELGKRYSTKKSGSFINGVLEKLKDLR